ncbi:hypothetical protein BV20DRAFT_415850 [Pilatotrama ljubarskyi]|nr:hypothetical protein BV20DRAFT_415850 [Pilatotrama ljubarskyi]
MDPSSPKPSHPADFIFPKHLQLRPGNRPLYKGAVELTCLRYGLSRHLKESENPYHEYTQPAEHARWPVEEDACKAIILCNIEDAEAHGFSPNEAWGISARGFWTSAGEMFAFSEPERWYNGWRGCVALCAVVCLAGMACNEYGPLIVKRARELSSRIDLDSVLREVGG